MASEKGLRSTLLIGVGGTGSSIAQSVYLRAHSTGADHSRLRVLAFDTDENDQRKLTGLNRNRESIRISSVDTVETLLDRYPEIEQEWFVVPRDSLPMELRQMTLLDGAGQVRMLTRLGLFDAIANGSLEAVLGNAVADLNRHDNQTTPVNHINVLMVGSLAGATGSGSFLQLAALLRDIALKRNVQLTVRGLFLMPDVYVSSGALPRLQIPNVLANGYASMKEFHAVTLKAAGRGGNYDFEFKYGADRIHSEGELPFASLTIIDYEDVAGGNLGRNLNAYKAMAVQAAFTLLFTPVGGQIDSTTVNDARSTVAAAGRGTHNRIAAIGISALTYPHQEIVEYLKCQVAQEVMSGDWIRLDRQFRNRLKSFRDQRAAGNMTIAEPQQSTAYLEDLRQLAVDEGLPFFAEIYRNLHPINRDEAGNEVTTSLTEQYLESLDNHLNRSFWGTEDLGSTLNRRNADDSQFASQTALVEEIRKRENRLEDDYRRVENALTTRPTDILVNLFAASDDTGAQDWKSHHLQYYLLRNGPHPVQSRSFLFELRTRLESIRNELNADELRQRYFRLSNGFRSEDEDKKNPTSRGTPNTLQTATDVAGRNAVTRLFKGGAKDFVGSYVTYYNATIRSLVEYAKARLREKSYDRLIQEIDEQIRVMGGLFQEIESLLEKLKGNIRDQELQHANDSMEGVSLYVCADKQCKEALWENTRDAMAGQKLEEGINKTITESVYQMARRNRINRKPEGLDTLRDKFKTSVIDGYAHERVSSDYSSIHSMSVIEAIKMEAEVKGEDPLSLFQNRIDIVRRQSQPMVTLTDPSAGQSIQFWSLNDELREQIGTIGNLNDILTSSSQGNQTIEEPEFPKNEILSVSMLVDLELAHLAKLSPPIDKQGSVAPDRAGRYFQEYQSMVDELVNAAAEQRAPSTITPHIHRDWHKPGLLPEISTSITQALLTNLNKSFVAALALNLLTFEERHGKPVAVINTLGRVRTGGVTVEIDASHDIYSIAKSFALYPEAIRGSLAVWNQGLNSSTTSDLTPDSLLSQLTDPEITERILSISATRRDVTTRDAKVSDLVHGFCTLLSEATVSAQPSLPENVIYEDVEKLINKIKNKALEKLRGNTDNETITTMNNRHAMGVESWRIDRSGNV